MTNRQKVEDLGRRERQVLELIYSLGEASVADVHVKLSNPPAYDTVRTVIRNLESKSFLRHRKVGTKYVYRPTQNRKTESRRALSRVLETFFHGASSDAVAAVFDLAVDDLTDDDLDCLLEKIDQARKEGR